MPTPPANATTSSFQLGTYAPLTDTFTQTLDLNDGTTFRIHPKGLKLAQPDKVVIESGNVRTAGVVVPRWQYKARHIQVEVSLRGNSTGAILASLRTLLSIVEHPPFCIRLALPGATLYSYADVLAVKHDIPSDTQQILAGAITRIHLDFECRVGLRGDRVTLQNLVPNAGAEQPSTANVLVFNDLFGSSASLNNYTVVAGATPTVAGNLMTITSGTTVTFGPTTWSDYAQWEVRFIFVTGLTATFYLQYSDANNYIAARLTSTSLVLVHVISGVTNTLTTQTFAALTNAAGYFLQITLFPAAPGEVAMVQAILSISSSGLPGPITATAGPVNTTNPPSGGHLGFTASGANLQVGGVNNVALFGPGGWGFATTAAATTASGAWERTTGNPYSGGPVASLGALRIDAPPAGAWDGKWQLYRGGTAPTWATGSFPMPISGFQQISASVWAKSSGLGASATVELTVGEYDATGTLLRSGVIATHTGNLAAWTQLSGTYTTGAGCIWVDIGCHAADATSGSPSAQIWFDNAQVWNKSQLATMTSMPWCDLRAVVSPAQLVVNGLAGDMDTPAQIAVGAYISSSPALIAGGNLALYLGRKQSTSPNAQLVGQSFGAYSPAFSPQSIPTLDPTTWGGVNPSATFGNGGGWNPRFTSPTSADAAGTYHLIARVMSRQSSGNLPNVSLRVATAQQTDPWFNQVSGTDIVGQWSGPYVYPFSAVNTWTIADAGQCVLPPFPQGALTDPSKLYLTPRAQWQDTSTGTAQELISWQTLLPVDGSLLLATVNNPTNGSGAISNTWLWTYGDALLLNRGGVGDTAAWTNSLESGPTPNPAAGAGGAGTSGSGSLNVNSGADPYLVLDPRQGGSNSATGVNQIVAIVTDQVGTVLPCYTEIQYTPLYLYPR